MVWPSSSIDFYLTKDLWIEEIRTSVSYMKPTNNGYFERLSQISGTHFIGKSVQISKNIHKNITQRLFYFNSF